MRSLKFIDIYILLYYYWPKYYKYLFKAIRKKVGKSEKQYRIDIHKNLNQSW